MVSPKALQILELRKRIASNKEWLRNNWYLGKHVRRDAQDNIDADEKRLAALEQEIK